MFDRLFETLIEEDVLHEAAFGVTEAGWIHPNGEVEVIPNYVMGDHDRDAFRKMRPDEDIPEGHSFSREYRKYLSQGHIRFIQSDRGFNVELLKKPTSSQMRAIRKGLEDNATGDMFFSILGGIGNTTWPKFREEMNKL